ncbi:MAG TPA: DUF1236 domain-containing protein [Xanthobacteraceae bacterium]|nr:DUF1236 domain-containing protein [Xanthobacteraceae bacterium]
MKANSMITLLVASIVSMTFAVGYLGTAAPARAQAPAPAQAPAVPQQPKVNLSLEQRHVIKELIKDLNVSPAAQNVETTVGATVPTSIKLNPMPQVVADKVPQIKSHLFFIEGGKVVIVDPKENKIVDAIE